MKKFLFASFALFALLPIVQVHAATTVHDQAELKAAIEDESVSEIVLANDIQTTEKINVLRSVTIDGNGHKMSYTGTFGDGSDYTTWAGIYVLQVYKANVTLKNITLTGGNAGLLVNGGSVTVVGKLDVSGNGFGGIELGQGEAVESSAHLVLNGDSTIVNTTETTDRPTLWVPDDSTGATLEVDGKVISLTEGKELTITEIQSFQVPEENANTLDFAPIYGMFILLGGMFLGLNKVYE